MVKPSRLNRSPIFYDYKGDTFFLSNSYRIIFERMPNGDILFISVGKHDIYKY